MKKILYLTAASLVMTSLAACDQNSGDDLDPVNGDDARFMAIADRFVNHTVIPTYTSLSDYTEQLVKDLETLKKDVTQENIDKACETFLTARAGLRDIPDRQSLLGKVGSLPLGSSHRLRNRPSYRHLAPRSHRTEGSPDERGPDPRSLR